MLMAERLKSARKEMNFTQEQVADMLGVDRSTYAYYELGNTNPNLSNLSKLAALFKVDVGWLIGSDSPMNVFCAPEPYLVIKKSIKERNITELSKEERQIIGFFRILKKCGKENELYSMLKKISQDIE